MLYSCSFASILFEIIMGSLGLLCEVVCCKTHVNLSYNVVFGVSFMKTKMSIPIIVILSHRQSEQLACSHAEWKRFQHSNCCGSLLIPDSIWVYTSYGTSFLVLNLNWFDNLMSITTHQFLISSLVKITWSIISILS